MRKSEKTPEKAPKAAPKASAVVAPVETEAAPPAARGAAEKASKSMTLWMTPSHFAQLDAEVARVQASCPAAKVTRSSYALHALLTHLEGQKG